MYTELITFVDMCGDSHTFESINEFAEAVQLEVEEVESALETAPFEDIYNDRTGREKDLMERLALERMEREAELERRALEEF